MFRIGHDRMSPSSSSREKINFSLKAVWVPVWLSGNLEVDPEARASSPVLLVHWRTQREGYLFTIIKLIISQHFPLRPLESR
jgi:hypothetical protein